MTSKGIRQISFETRQLIDRLSKMAVGETISYQEIMKTCELASINACRGYLNTARKSLRKENILFEVIRGESLRRMSDEEIAKNCPAWRRTRIRSQARGMVKDTNAIKDIGSLSDEAQLSVYVAQAEAAIIDKTTSRKMTSRLTDAARAKSEELLVGESLRVLMQD